MKMQNTSKTEGFQPVTISITFESQNEINLIRRTLGWNQSIPKLVAPEGSEDYTTIKAFVDSLRGLLEEVK